MVSPIQQTWVIAEITLRRLASPTNTRVFKFTQQQIFSDSGLPDDYDAVILEIDGLGVQLDSFIPKSTNAKLVIDNSPGSLGFERRFSDFFERHAVINQSIKISAFTNDVNNIPGVVLPKELWEGVIKDYSIAFDGNTLELSITNNPIPQRIITKEITRQEFPDAPQRSFGKHLPVVFGFKDTIDPLKDIGLLVPGYQINSDNESPDWAYATNFSDFENAGVGLLLSESLQVGAKDRLGRIVRVDSAVGNEFTRGGPAGTTIPGLQIERAFQINYIPGTTPGTDEPLILTHLRVEFDGDTIPGAFDLNVLGAWTVRIYENINFGVGKDYPVDPPVAQGTRDKSDFTAQIRVGPDYSVDFPLNQPLVMRDDVEYWWSIFATNETNSGNNALRGLTALNTIAALDGGPLGYRFRLDPAGAATEAPNQWDLLSEITLTADVAPLGINFTDTPGGNGIDPASGLSYSFITAANPTNNSTDLALDRVLPFFEIDGLRDDASGTVTGLSGAPIATGQDVAHFLHLDWDADTLSVIDILFDDAIYSSTHPEFSGSVGANFPREVKGYTTGRSTAQNTMNEVFRNMAGRLVKLNQFDPSVGAYAWGDTSTDTALLDDDDILVLEFTSEGIDTVINNVAMSYFREIGTSQVEDVTGQGGERAYTRFLGLNHSDGGDGEIISGDSGTLYGNRPLRTTRFNWILHDEDADSVSKFYLITGDRPHEFVRIRVPYDKFKDLNVLETLTIRAPQLPAYFGTSSDPFPAIYSGDNENAEFIEGEYLVRATSKRVQINSVNFNFPNDDVPTIDLVCRLLIHESDPT